MSPGISAANTFSELGGLQSINALAKTDSGAALGQVARQFEGGGGHKAAQIVGVGKKGHQRRVFD